MTSGHGASVLEMSVSLPTLPRRIHGASLPPGGHAIGSPKVENRNARWSDDTATLVRILAALLAWDASAGPDMASGGDDHLPS